MHTSTLTIRLPQAQRAALKETAKRLNQSESDFIRELLARELDQHAFGTRTSEVVGCLASGPVVAKPDAFRDTIQRNNWRPQ